MQVLLACFSIPILPKSSLLILVAAFAGYDVLMQAYQIAIKEQYRLFSYGDGMLVI